MYKAVASTPVTSLVGGVAKLLEVNRAKESCLHVIWHSGGARAIVPMGLKRFEVVCGTGILRLLSRGLASPIRSSDWDHHAHATEHELSRDTAQQCSRWLRGMPTLMRLRRLRGLFGTSRLIRFLST